MQLKSVGFARRRPHTTTRRKTGCVEEAAAEAAADGAVMRHPLKCKKHADRGWARPIAAPAAAAGGVCSLVGIKLRNTACIIEHIATVSGGDMLLVGRGWWVRCGYSQRHLKLLLQFFHSRFQALNFRL